MEHALYLRGIKQGLKSRGMTYSELAQGLKMSESGVKKMLNAKDISFRRVLKICDVLGVLPSQLFLISEKSSIPTVKLTPVQEAALLKDRTLLAVYWLMTVERRSQSEIETRLDLPSARLRQYLIRLRKLHLIEERTGVFRPLQLGKFKWPDDLKLTALLNREWSKLTLDRALSRKKDGTHRLIAVRLSQDAYDLLRKRLWEALDEAVQTSEREEMTLPARQLHNVTAVIASVKQGIFD